MSIALISAVSFFDCHHAHSTASPAAQMVLCVIALPAKPHGRLTRTVRVEPDGTVTIGITDYAQAQLGDIVFVELPKAADEPDVMRFRHEAGDGTDEERALLLAEGECRDVVGDALRPGRVVDAREGHRLVARDAHHQLVEEGQVGAGREERTRRR